MSIESNIQELTEAIKALTAAIVMAQGGTNAKATPEVKPPKADKTAEKPAAAGAQHGATLPSTGQADVQEKPQGIPFKQLADVAIKLNTKDYAALKGICDREKIAKISGLAESEWLRVHDEIVGLLGE